MIESQTELSVRERRYSIFTRVNLVYTLLVILWGVYVRATGSGAGCGAHWPLCNGEILPRAERIQTVIEFMHRGSSGVSLILIAIGLGWAFRVSEKGAALRRAAVFSAVAIVLEALLGAALVLFKLVEFDQSVARAISISLHLMNTLFLLGTLATLCFLSGHSESYKSRSAELSIFPKAVLFVSSVAMFIFLGVTGAITALGDTLFPSASLTAGFQQDIAENAHFLLRLRGLHPVLAVLWIVSVFIWSKKLETRELLGIRSLLLGLVILQFFLGFLNWMLMAPNALQLIHLLVADLVFMTLWISGLKYETRKGWYKA